MLLSGVTEIYGSPNASTNVRDAWTENVRSLGRLKYRRKQIIIRENDLLFYVNKLLFANNFKNVREIRRFLPSKELPSSNGCNICDILPRRLLPIITNDNASGFLPPFLSQQGVRLEAYDRPTWETGRVFGR